jgi:hypothetical protein
MRWRALDCDGTADEEAIDPATWYADADGDGYGDAAVTAEACAQPSGFVADDQDCDDENAMVNPGATEVWYDGLDQDCSGGDDYDQDGDGFPAEVSGGNDCDDLDAGLSPRDADGDGFSTCTGDCDDGTAGDYPGAVTDHEGIAMTCLGRGTCWMGSPPEEVGHDDDETQHEVTLTRAFWLGVYEVTQAEFAFFMGYDPSTYDCDGCPVTDITWHEAAAFANEVSDEDCYDCNGSGADVQCEPLPTSPYACAGYRLPTEAL